MRTHTETSDGRILFREEAPDPGASLDSIARLDPSAYGDDGRWLTGLDLGQIVDMEA